MDQEIYNKVKIYLRQIIKGSEFENNLFAVGGCCRDELLNLPIKDVDLVVSLPDGGIRFVEWLKEHNYNIGSTTIYERFGTARFRLKEFPDEEFEIVHTRSEYYHDDSRKPETTYGTIKQDAERRDFTVNTLYYDISNDKLIDILGKSLTDIKNKHIVTPIDPNISFSDDPLRILRAFRFCCKLNWFIDVDTYNSIKYNVDRLSIISKERINDEFKKILNTPNFSYGLRDLMDTGIMKYIFPSVKYIPDNIKNFNFKTDFYPILISLNLNNENVTEELKTLKFSNFETDYITNIIECINYSIIKMRKYKRESDICRNIKKLGSEQAFKDADKVCSVMDIHSDFMYYKDKYMDIINYKLPINGDDVMETLNIGPCKRVKEILNYCMDMVFDKRIDNNKEEMIKYIKEYSKYGL